jgi:3-methyladenine DNA glycosylase/8-oxoguanine DNA glycosylase
MGTKFTLPVPRDYRLARDFCSYGYFLLEPNLWDPRARELITTLDLGGSQAAGGAVTLRVKQGAGRRGGTLVPTGASPTLPVDPDDPGPGRAGADLTITADRALSAPQRRAVRAALTRMLRLDEDDRHVAEFHALDPRFSASGRARLMRSASLFEDVIKTVTSCNVTWPSTVAMNAKLCRVFGRRSASGLHAFPTAAKLARARPATLRARCSVGYRDARIVQLASIWTGALREGSGGHAARWSTLADDELFGELQELPGIGPYAAANIMQLLGRYAHLPLDTESIRHGRTVLGFTGGPRQVMKRVQRHFEPFGAHRFRSYWFELWRFYEARRGASWTWERATTGKTFTAAQLD